jgi:hypothetical protein
MSVAQKLKSMVANTFNSSVPNCAKNGSLGVQVVRKVTA